MNVNSVRVIVRHSADCPAKSEGSEWKKCDCPKSLQVYTGGGSGATKRISAKTRSWTEAERQAVKMRESFDPVQQELKRLRATEELKLKPLTAAIDDYITAMHANNRASGTVENVRHLLAKMAASLNASSVSEVSTEMLDRWRSTWEGEPSTNRQKISNLKAFFSFCVARKWTDESPAGPLKRPTITGEKTAAFSDQQLESIASVVAGDQLTAAMFGLLRWSGCGISDAVKFSLNQVDDNGIFRYSRQKTKRLALPKLPPDVIAMLRALPDRPFMNGGGIELKSEVRRWQERFQNIFNEAGIGKIQAEGGRLRRAHVSMFRPTCAVSKLDAGLPVDDVALMLGDSIAVVQRHYLPMCTKREDAHLRELQKAESKELAALRPTTSKKVTKIA